MNGLLFFGIVWCLLEARPFLMILKGNVALLRDGLDWAIPVGTISAVAPGTGVKPMWLPESHHLGLADKLHKSPGLPKAGGYVRHLNSFSFSVCWRRSLDDDVRVANRRAGQQMFPGIFRDSMLSKRDLRSLALRYSNNCEVCLG